jgi:hypothetical protein
MFEYAEKEKNSFTFNQKENLITFRLLQLLVGGNKKQSLKENFYFIRSFASRKQKLKKSAQSKYFVRSYRII